MLCLFCHDIKQGLIAVHNIINNIIIADSLKMLSHTVYLTFFNITKLHRRHRSFCFRYEIYVLYLAFIESDSPVRIVLAYGVEI